MSISEKYQLLYIEDDRDWQERISSILVDDHDVTSCETIDDALSQLRSGKQYDYAVLDLTIDKAGSEFEITTPEELLDFMIDELQIPVVILTGVMTSVANKIEANYGVKVFDKGNFDSANISSLKEQAYKAHFNRHNTGNE